MDGFNTSGTRSDNYNSAVTKRVNLVSYYEWQTGLDTGTGNSISYSTEPIVNSVGDLWCRAQYSDHSSFPAENNCLGQNVGSGFRYPWLRSANSSDADNAWLVYGISSDSLNDYYTNYTYGVLPAVWLSSAVSTTGGSGTYAGPYCLVVDDPLCTANLAVTTTTGSAASGITLTGTAKASDNNQNMTVWADACNTAGQCVRKTKTDFDSSNSSIEQRWILNWEAAELPAGTYNGTVWVGLATSVSGTTMDTLAVQSGVVNFAISSVVKTYPVMVIKDQAFTLNVGALSNYDLDTTSLPAASNGVTADKSGSDLVLSSAAGTGLNSATAATFGNASFVFTVQEKASGTMMVNF
jgi:hypothetical protein